MLKTTEESLKIVRDTLDLDQKYAHACHVLNYDMETICPQEGMEEQGEVTAFLSNEAFKLRKDQKFVNAAEDLYAHIDELDPLDAVLAKELHRSYLQDKNVTPEKQLELSKVYNKAFVDWTAARKEGDFSLFADSLAAVDKAGKELVDLRERTPEEESYSVYDMMLNDYERGMISGKLDVTFDRCKEVLVPMLDKIMASKVKIRKDFLSIKVTDEQQKQMADYLLDVMGFDLSRGAYTTSEHPFTDGLARNDTRITTHYYEDAFISSMYSIIHECGHALFEMMQDPADYDHFINDNMTLGMHESVSRFYENRIGRSKEFVHLIYPKVCEIFPQVMGDVSEEELFLALNIVEPSLIRTEADEFTYTLHIIIRYEIEKEIVSGKLATGEVGKRWKEKYKEYLGIEPSGDRDGVLQDVHWTSGFGYFPTYAIGNMYNSMYIKTMAKNIDIEKCVAAGDFASINGWMKDHVFAKANRLAPAEWIKDITGREFTPEDFLEYLSEKYTKIYEL